MVTIKAVNLTKKFDQVTAVDNLNLEIEEGEIFGLVGPDGAGKTTTMRLLTGILTPTSGKRWIGQAADIGYMPQRFGLYEDLTVIENLDFYADIYCLPLSEKEARFERLLGFSGLSPFKKRLAGNLSGGMKQKLGLACALVHAPKVLFLDEPTNGVDPVSRRDFWQILYQLLKEKVSILFSTSYLDEAERCARVGLMHKGKLLKCDLPSKIKDELRAESLEQAFISIIKENESAK